MTVKCGLARFSRRSRGTAVFAAVALTGCAMRPPAPHLMAEHALAPAGSGVLAMTAERVLDEADGGSAFRLLVENDDALLWRLALADHATTSIDAQYFIWSNDEAGGLLFRRLLAAADRGVRIRLLVDDFAIAASDRNLAIYASHPNVEIRLFNPGRIRESALGAVGDMLLDFEDMNRRMHNKLFVVDGRIAVVGGRNVGNPYFGLGERYNFRDLDVLVIGPVVPEISEAFDHYWNAELAYPAQALRDDVSAADLGELRETLARTLTERAAILAAYPLETKDWTPLLETLPASMKLGDASFLQDEPLRTHDEQPRLRDMLGRLVEPSREELLIVTPYLIPVGSFLANVAKLEAGDVRVRILTASMGANNHTIAHSHYKKYRRRILDTGAELHELRHDPSAAVRAAADVSPVTSRFTALHIKTLIGDRRRCFIGSVNLDPRALEINTENGLYIESAPLASELAALFDDLSSERNAWRVDLDDDGRLRWRSLDETTSRQPARSMGQRIADFFFRLLPVESQL